MASEKGSRKDKNQNIQVFVRLRPLNQREKDIRSLGVVEVVNGREVIVRQSSQSAHTKKFTFDRAFPPQSKQVEVYQEVVSPLIEEVLAGYNCTVFAYGQTGTGKTHTMVGEAATDEMSWQNDPQAGIIPRALSQLFDELRLTNTEYTVRVSYLELYNEELFDLLSSSEDNSKLRIYEDVTRKGSNIVNGLEEITVYNKNEVYKIMSQGQERKRVASTLMNAQSSRSHTVFTIVVHMKENSPEGEELVKIGKLNLVDLAGSENISKAGSDNPARKERARECVNINQSLLTLGRVITALVERHPHIPYRESKLTRILQESLGGRTKTSIIATISPGHKDLEETMSTLEYANRAKNIQNKPEINQKMTKKAILKEYAEEIDRLKRDLQASRDKNGVYLANETYTELTFKQEEQRKEIQELLLKKRALEEEREKAERMFSELNMVLESERQRCAETYNQLCGVESRLADTRYALQETKQHFEEQRHIVQKQVETERTLSAQAKQLLQVADLASNDATCLHNTVDKRKSVENTNLEVTRTYRESSARHRATAREVTQQHRNNTERGLQQLLHAAEQYTNENCESLSQNKQQIDELLLLSKDTIEKLSTLPIELHSTLSTSLSSTRQHISDAATSTQSHIVDVTRRVATCVATCLQRASDVDVADDLDKFLQFWSSEASQRLSALAAAQSRWVGATEQTCQRVCARARGAAEALRDRRAAAAARRDRTLQLIAQDKKETDQRIAKELAGIEQEKVELENRLAAWAEQERRLLEQRIQTHIDDQLDYLREKHEQRLQAIEENRKEFEKRMQNYITWLKEIDDVGVKETTDMVENWEECGNEMDIHGADARAMFVDCDKAKDSLSNVCEELSGNALKIVQQVKKDLLTALTDTQNYAQQETADVISLNDEQMAKLVSTLNLAMDSFATSCQQTAMSMSEKMQNTSTKSATKITSLSSQVDNLISKVQEQKRAQEQILRNLNDNTQNFTECLLEEVDDMEQLEKTCLNEQYVVYSPTGATPARRQYSFPRSLASTSPHEKIVARFRAMRDLTEDSGSESTESEDSAVAASPPASEADVHRDQRRQTQEQKENLSRQNSFKKPSKLPSLSAKKPLAERN